MPTSTQVNDTTWNILYKSINYTVQKYYDGGYTIRNIEGIFTSLQDVVSYLIMFY